MTKDFATKETKRMSPVKADEPKPEQPKEVPVWADWGDEP